MNVMTMYAPLTLVRDMVPVSRTSTRFDVSKKERNTVVRNYGTVRTKENHRDEFESMLSRHLVDTYA